MHAGRTETAVYDDAATGVICYNYRMKEYKKPMAKNWQFSPKVSLKESLSLEKPEAEGNLDIEIMDKPNG